MGSFDINKISYWELARTACVGTMISVSIAAVFVATLIIFG